LGSVNLTKFVRVEHLVRAAAGLVPGLVGVYQINARIPGAQLVLIPFAGHIYTTDQPEPAHRAVLDFLAKFN
jgi:pimeloyl-ACP methyl ester carboxylesterase